MSIKGEMDKYIVAQKGTNYCHTLKMVCTMWSKRKQMRAHRYRVLPLRHNSKQAEWISGD